MTGRLAGKVALVTGAARGQGRSHAVRMAEEGADIVCLDICAPIASITAYPPAAKADLTETARLIRAVGQRAVSFVTDVRDRPGLEAAVAAGVTQLGRLDIVCANAGIYQKAPALELEDEAWREMIDIDLTGAWNTARATAPHLIRGGRGGSVIMVSSIAGIRAPENSVHYNAAKHGVIGIAHSLARELARYSIRVNAVSPGTVDTHMIQNESVWRIFDPSNPRPTQASAIGPFTRFNALPIPWVDPIDVSHAVVFLASDEARYITGTVLPIDAGALLRS